MWITPTLQEMSGYNGPTNDSPELPFRENGHIFFRNTFWLTDNPSTSHHLPNLVLLSSRCPAMVVLLVTIRFHFWFSGPFSRCRFIFSTSQCRLMGGLFQGKMLGAPGIRHMPSTEMRWPNSTRLTSEVPHAFF